MKENSKAYKGNSTAMKAVNAGEVDAALIYHYYYYGDQAKTGENSKNVTPFYFKNQDPGAFVSISGGGVLKSSKNAAAAQSFLKFITGKKGQEVLQKGTSFEYAVGLGRPVQRQAGSAQGVAGPHRGSRQTQFRQGHRADDPGRTAVAAVTSKLAVPGPSGDLTTTRRRRAGANAPARLSASLSCPSSRS